MKRLRHNPAGKAREPQRYTALSSPGRREFIRPVQVLKRSVAAVDLNHPPGEVLQLTEHKRAAVLGQNSEYEGKHE
ncbi:MAG: hypothetical protein WA437_22085 [Candidatus Sulfotelmatobacter sp.]